MKIRFVIMLLAVSTGICVFSACGNQNSDVPPQMNSLQQVTSSKETTSVQDTRTSETNILPEDNELQSRLEAGEIVCIDSGTSVDLD